MRVDWAKSQREDAITHYIGKEEARGFRMKPQRSSASASGYAVEKLIACANTTYRTHLKLNGWGRYA